MIAATEIKVAEWAGTKRVIYSCKRCKQITARDYLRQDGNLKMFRIEDGDVIYQENDMLCDNHDCPKSIYRSTLKATFVNAIENKEHKCDARCIHAKGKDCSCECKGENHGKAFLI